MSDNLDLTAEAQALLDIHKRIVQLHAAGKLEKHLPSGLIDGPAFADYENSIHMLVRVLGTFEMHASHLDGSEAAVPHSVHGKLIHDSLNYRLGVRP